MIPINFCPRCGHAVEDQVRFGKARRVCPNCDYVHFDDPKVAVAAFIVQGEQVLLVQRGIDPQKGLWALPAGYVDRGEDPQNAALREVFEETGLQVELSGLIGVYFSTPTITIVYRARIISGILAAQDDAADARWFNRNEIPELAFESTHQLIAAWLAEANNP